MYTDPFGLRTCPPDCGLIHAVGGVAFGTVSALAVGLATSPSGPGAVVSAGLAGAFGFTAGVAAANIAESTADAGVEAMSKAGRAIRTLVTGLLIGSSARVVPGRPEDGDATQAGTGTRPIPGAEAPPGPPVARPDTGTTRPDKPDEQ